jgi:uncharacterized protein YbjT (DUF2867 family)
MILVTGATGNVGREVVQELLRDGRSVRVLTRNPTRVSLPPDVEVASGDLSASDGLKALLDGIRDLFLIRVPGSDPFLQMARQCGVERVVFLSSSAIDSPTENAIGRSHRHTEELIRQSGLKWTFVRPGAFMSNSLQWSGSIRSEGVVRAPFGDVATAPIDPRDIASVAATALTSAGHDGQIYTLTGPEALTPREQVRILSTVLGSEIRFEDVPAALAEAHMKRVAPPEIVDALFALMRDQAKRPAQILDTAPQVTGVPAHTFAQWAADHAGLFR